MYEIKTNLNGVIFSVLHFLMHKYISLKEEGSDGEMMIKNKFK